MCVRLQVPAGVFFAAGAQLLRCLCQASELQELCGIPDDALCSLKAAAKLVGACAVLRCPQHDVACFAPLISVRRAPCTGPTSLTRCRCVMEGVVCGWARGLSAPRQACHPRTGIHQSACEPCASVGGHMLPTATH
jgi:hypothetical protein